MHGVVVQHEDRVGCVLSRLESCEERHAHHVVIARQQQHLCVVGQLESERGILAGDATMLLELRILAMEVILEPRHDVARARERCNGAVAVDAENFQVSRRCCRAPVVVADVHAGDLGVAQVG